MNIFSKQLELITVKYVENQEWDHSKSLLILGIIKMEVDSNYHFECSEYEHLKPFEKHQQVYYECNNCMLSTKSNIEYSFSKESAEFKVTYSFDTKLVFDTCQQFRVTTFSTKSGHAPLFLIAKVKQELGKEITVSEMS